MPTDDFLKYTPEEKKQLQLERLQSTLNRAYRQVNFHKKRMQASGFEPDQVESIDDLTRLPFLNRSDFSEHYPYELFAVPLRDIVRIHTAPGTSRNPTVSGYTSQDLSMWRRITERALSAASVSSHDILQISFNPGLNNWGRDYKDSAENMGVSVIPNTQLSINKHFMVLRDYKTTVLVTTPALATQLADYMYREQVGPAVLKLQSIIIAGETISEDFRKKIEERTFASCWLHYGLSEVPGPAIAFECHVHNGLHISEDHFIAEIIDSETEVVLPAGETGELVLTTLTTRAFPLIRFRTGDMARIETVPCECGNPLARMQWLNERADNIMKIDGVNIHEKQVYNVLKNALPALSGQVVCRVKEDNGRKLLEILLPMNERIFSDEVKELETLLRGIENRLREDLGVLVVIRLIESTSRELYV